MKRKRITSTDFSLKERSYWRNLEVNLDSFSNRWEELYLDDFQDKLLVLTNDFVKDILSHFGIQHDTKLSLKATLLRHRRSSILTYCIIVFIEQNPKILSEIFKIPYVKKKPDLPKISQVVFDEYKKDRLVDLFLFLLRRRLGKGKYQFNFLNDIIDSDYTKVEDLMNNVARLLKRREKDNKIYSYRFGYKGRNGEWLYLLLKETHDKVHLAIPNNISMVKGTYKLITINSKNKSIDINTTSKDEAFIIRNYFNENLKNPNTYRREESRYKPSDFFKKILTLDANSLIKLIEVDIKSDNTSLKSSLKDPHSKNDITERLKVQQDNGTLSLKDFSEFNALIFLFKNLRIRVQVLETNWGIHRLNLIDKRLSSDDLIAFKEAFAKRYGIELDKWLNPSEGTMDHNRIIGKILDKTTIPVNTITEDIDKQLWGLFENSIISKAQHSAQRICVNQTCRHKTWSKNACPRCGNPLRIDGDFVEIKTNLKGIFDYTYKAIKSIPGLKVSRDKIQIAGKKYSIIHMMNKSGDDLSVFISKGKVPEEIVNHYSANGLPLLVILTHYKEAIHQSISAKNFECSSLVDLYYNYSAINNSPNKVWLTNTFNKYITDQKSKWKEKLLQKGLNSYNAIINKSNLYTDQNFESDIFNMLHEIFYVAYKLGGSFTGIKAPDAIVSVRNYRTPVKKFCMSYDCKYSTSTDGYQLNDKEEKHRYYIRKLRTNQRVKFYGNLKVHAIISQNMDMNRYEAFYQRVTKGFKWNGQMLFIDEKIITKLYDFYRLNSEKILSKPDIFYAELFNVFTKFKKKELLPYPQISEDKMSLFYQEIISKYTEHHIELTFERRDFK